MTCSPGCGPGEFTTSAGCTACNKIEALVRERLESAADSQGGCTADGDCVAANTSLSCGEYCDLAVRADGLEAFRTAAAAIEIEDCSFDHWGCRSGNPNCDLSGDIRCVEGVCRELPVCDPQRYRPGDACDDGRVCTNDDICVDTRCVGAQIACDDGNPCTDDACDPVSGCTDVANAAACDASTSCSIGAQCADSACVTSGASGFSRTYADPYRAAAAIAVSAENTSIGGWTGKENSSTAFINDFDMAFSIAADGPNFVVAYRSIVNSSPNVVIVRISSDGTIRSSIDLFNPSSDSVLGLLALPDGDTVIWGSAGDQAWIRRVGTTVEWEMPFRVEAATVRDGAIDLLGSDGQFDGHGWQAASGATWLSRMTFDGREEYRVVMPRGSGIWDAAPIDNGFLLVGNIASGVGNTADSKLWLRQATTIPACLP